MPAQPAPITATSAVPLILLDTKAPEKPVVCHDSSAYKLMNDVLHSKPSRIAVNWPTRRIACFFSVLIVAAVASACAMPVGGKDDASPPRFSVDANWPKPLPNGWILGQVSGVATDANDHVWVLQRPRSLTEDGRGATLNPPQSICWVLSQ